MAKTLTYNQGAEGWPSFYSFVPEMMIGMNSYLYSFKGGDLYRHNTNETRNNFYGSQFTSTIKAVVNDEPQTTKTFNTISLQGNSAWDCTVTTNLGSGLINNSYFDLKEGQYYAFIRRNPDQTDLDFRSAQGIGTVTTVDSSTPSATTLTFDFNIDSIASVGDTLYRSTLSGSNNENASTPSEIGDITDISGAVITVNVTGATPANGNYILYFKDSLAESYSPKGYYLEYELENNSTSFVELYGVSVSLHKSFS